MTASTGAPAGTISQMRFGLCKRLTNSSNVPATAIFLPLNFSTDAFRFAASISKPTTGNPWLSMFRARFCPITPKPIIPMVYFMVYLLFFKFTFFPFQTPLKAEKPPSMGTTMPVTNEEAGEISQTMVLIKSCGSPKRPAGVCAKICFPRSVSSPVFSSISK